MLLRIRHGGDMNYQYRNAELSNGITLVTIHRPGAATSTISAHIRVGSRFETRRQRGLSHFLEHMVFQGCGLYPTPRAVNIAAEFMGSTLDAATARDYTQFEHQVANDALGKSAELLASLLRTPVFDNLESERSIILEEAMDEFSADGRRIDPDTLTKQSLWGKSGLGQPIIGDLETIQGFSRRDLERFHKRHYCGRNLILSIASPFGHEQMRDIARPFEEMPTGIRSEFKPVISALSRPKVMLIPEQRSQCDCRLIFPTSGRLIESNRRFVMLRRALDDGLASRMQERLGNELGLAYDQWAYWESYPDTGAFELGAIVSPDKVPIFFTEIWRLLKNLVLQPPTGEELDRLRFRVRWGLQSAIESASGLIALHGFPHLYEEKDDPVSDRLERLSSITSEDLAASAACLLDSPFIASVMGPCDALSVRKVRRAIATADT